MKPGWRRAGACESDARCVLVCDNLFDLSGGDYEHPLICIPIKIKEQVIGVITVYKLLVQKQELTTVDYELFSMLAWHAATALFSSQLYSHSERK